MTREELGFEAYVLLGNALHLLLHGVKGDDQQRLALPVGDLWRLQAWLEPIRPDAMLRSLERLPQADRTRLGEALSLCERLADTQAEHLLGAPADARHAVVDLLLQPKLETEETA